MRLTIPYEPHGSHPVETMEFTPMPPSKALRV
jgi:hypothetical protein